MIISRGRRYVFVHIPKSGGTSLSLALEDRAMKDDILVGDTPKALRRRKRLKAMTGAKRLRKHGILSDIDGIVSADELRSMFTFTLVRNPWDRMVSYYHWLRHQTFEHPAVGLARKLPFTEFVLHADTARSFAANPARRYMTLANGVEHCSAYIRLEQFDKDAEPLFEHLGFRLSLPQSNRSDRAADYRGYFTPKTRAAVAAACAEDIERFGYGFDDFGI
jgi:hypothetical protein